MRWFPQGPQPTLEEARTWPLQLPAGRRPLNQRTLNFLENSGCERQLHAKRGSPLPPQAGRDDADVETEAQRGLKLAQDHTALTLQS